MISHKNKVNGIDDDRIYIENQRLKNRAILNKKLKDEELKILCAQMGILIQSGCNIIYILQIIKEQSNKHIKYIVDDINKYIHIGNSISDSFDRTGKFSPFFISMIRAGEKSGNLDKSMYSLEKYYESSYKYKSKIKSVLIYPSIVFIIFLISSIIMINTVIPSYESIFKSNDITPPFITNLIISFSNILRHNFKMIIILSILIGIVIFAFIKINIKNIKDNLILSTPILNTLFKISLVARFSLTLRILIESGIQILEAIDICANTVDNKILKNKINLSNEYIKKGESIFSSLELSDIFPKMFISMIKIGEETGALEHSLKTTEKFYENQLELKIDKLIKYMEPVITLIIGLFVGIFIIAMSMPMFDVVTVF